jgi:hypothetical protein
MTFIIAAYGLVILYLGLHNSRMVPITLDLGKFANTKRVTFDEPLVYTKKHVYD